jgi:hypothetical protein
MQKYFQSGCRQTFGADDGYAGEPVTLMAPQEVPALKA